MVLSACSSDVELNAPYKSTTIVFGLLNPDANNDGETTPLDTQWIKINKTFLGEGDNLSYAAIRDSSEYDDEDIETMVVYQMDEDEIIHEYPLHAIEVSNKSVDGIFYGPEQTLYYFIPDNGMSKEYEYQIYLKFTDGHEVTGRTNLIDNEFQWLVPQSGFPLVLANISGVNSVSYVDPVSFKWYAPENASLYSGTLRMYYTEEVYASSDWTVAPISSTEKWADFPIGTIEQGETQPGQIITLGFSGRSFFDFLANTIEASPNIRRIIGHYDNLQSKTICFEAIMTVANEELATYVEVNTPSGSVVQERPVYTNVNNGLGLFASRSVSRVKNLPLIAVDGQLGIPNEGNLYALVVASNTSGLNFCDPNGTSDFPCE